jgi:hypothetical protein
LHGFGQEPEPSEVVPQGLVHGAQRGCRHSG